jgi:DNA-binding IclR family transcriptional regulator
MQRSNIRRNPADLDGGRSTGQRMAAMAARPAKPIRSHAEPEPASGSAERTLRLLSLIADLGRPMSLAELAQRLSLPKPTVHRLANNLLVSGYLARDVDERMFVPGAALRRLALNTLNHSTLQGLRHGVLRALVAEVGETCNFTTLDGTQVLYLDRVEAKWPLRLTIDVGEHVPLHCTASGKLFLAHKPKRDRNALIRQLKLERLTPHTITDPDRLRAECDAIVKRGFSWDREEFVLGLTAIAVPVVDSSGSVRAAVAVHAPTGRMTFDQASARLETFRGAATEMARLL